MHREIAIAFVVSVRLVSERGTGSRPIPRSPFSRAITSGIRKICGEPLPKGIIKRNSLGFGVSRKNKQPKQRFDVWQRQPTCGKSFCIREGRSGSTLGVPAATASAGLPLAGSRQCPRRDLLNRAVKSSTISRTRDGRSAFGRTRSSSATARSGADMFIDIEFGLACCSLRVRQPR